MYSMKYGASRLGSDQLARALDLVVHGLQHGSAGGACAWRAPAPRASAAAQRPPARSCHDHRRSHFAPPLLLSIVVGSGSSGGRSFDLAFFSISISETRIAGDTAETGTLPDSAPQ